MLNQLRKIKLLGNQTYKINIQKGKSKNIGKGKAKKAIAIKQDNQVLMRPTVSLFHNNIKLDTDNYKNIKLALPISTNIGFVKCHLNNKFSNMR